MREIEHRWSAALNDEPLGKEALQQHIEALSPRLKAPLLFTLTGEFREPTRAHARELHATAAVAGGHRVGVDHREQEPIELTP